MRAALQALREARPESIVDLHNNSGNNPVYAVGQSRDPVRLMLASLFATRYVTSRLSLGTFMEAFDGAAPTITVECGRAGDPAADATATAGLARFLSLERLDPIFVSPQPMAILIDPVRVCARAGVTLAFSDDARAVTAGDVDLALDREIDRHNCRTLDQGSVLGWIRPGAQWPLEAIDETGRDLSRELFREEHGALMTNASVVPIMLTTDPESALGDCLFYVVHQRQ